MKTIKRIKKTVKMGVVLSIAAIALSVYSASSASALEAGPSLDEDIMIEFDDFIFDEELIPLFGTDVDIEASGCLPHWMGPEGINITVTNNNDGPKHYEVFVYDGVVEIEQTPEFTFPEEDTWSDSELLFSEDTFEFQYRGTFDTPSAAVLRVKITEGPLVLLIDVEDDVIVEADVIFDEEIIVCEYDAEQMLSEAAEEYEAAEALAEAEAAAAEAQAQAEAAAQAQAEAEAQATAEAEELEAELADAEEAAAEAQAALDSMIEAVSVDIESDSQETPSSNESTETASQNQPLVDGEQAIGDSLPENTDNSGLPIAMIIVVTLIGLLGLAAAGTAALNMNR
ncbi:MAG: hypothetical protein H2036_07270 [Acidimicrobiales bacterium]|nr:hypothetical protein [Acidimicrobiales bacterium]|tara:strand:- start:133 stop:1155 length:1023 start_codon:yes stop_codon:yes gene_type:complete